MALISIIIPVLNEEKALPVTLESLQQLRLKGTEIIVVDGGSTDNTWGIAEQYADKVVSAKAGRANQLNKGAEVSQGSLLLFLHADTQLPGNAFGLLKEYVRQDQCWGRFNVCLNDVAWVYRVIEGMMNVRSCLTGIVTGDQAMFVSKVLFERVGGFPSIALMEDIAISKKLKKQQSLICLKERVITSARRWQENGVIATVLLMWRLRLLYFFKRSPEELAKAYRHARSK